MRARRPSKIRDLIVVGGNRATLSPGAKILGRIEAESGCLSEAADAPSAVNRAVCLRSIFQNANAAAGADFANGVHVRRAPVEVNGNHGSRPRSNRPLEEFW